MRTADFVTTDEGTGVVHVAPAYGEDDLRLGMSHGLPVLHGVGLDGCFLPEVRPVAGRFFKDADPVLIDLLRESGRLYRSGTYLHNYPHGWRTGDPLIYYAKHAWYIRTTARRERLVELNRTINWVPENVRDGRFGNWLEHNIDWALSRERFWGTPLPIWTDGEGDFMCIGSVSELEALAGCELGSLDLHRPAVDEVEFVHPENGRTYRRVPEVIDCWFDSGAMSYAQWHWPFENRERFPERFPARLHLRGRRPDPRLGSTPCTPSPPWSRTASPFATASASGTSSTSTGRRCRSRSATSSIRGTSSIRSAPIRCAGTSRARIAPGNQKRISVDLVREVAQTFINTWWNTYAFFVLYARLDRVDLKNEVPIERRPEIDRWILALLQRTIETVTACMDAYDAQGAGQAIESFVDRLSNWYVRRNRRRFWKAAAGEDKQAAYLTLHECLDAANRMMAPLMPFTAEAVYANLVRTVDPASPMSVHVAPWPQPEEAKKDETLTRDFEAVFQVVTLGRAARNDSRIRVRQPLPRVVVRTPSEDAARAVKRLETHVLDELNIKQLELVAQDTDLVSYRIRPNLPRLGKRHGRLIPAIRQALEAAPEAVRRAIAQATARGAGYRLEAGGEALELEAEDFLVESTSAEGYACAEENGYLVGPRYTHRRPAPPRRAGARARAHRAGGAQAGRARSLGPDPPRDLGIGGGRGGPRGAPRVRHGGDPERRALRQRRIRGRVRDRAPPGRRALVHRTRPPIAA